MVIYEYISNVAFFNLTLNLSVSYCLHFQLKCFLPSSNNTIFYIVHTFNFDQSEGVAWLNVKDTLHPQIQHGNLKVMQWMWCSSVAEVGIIELPSTLSISRPQQNNNKVSNGWLTARIAKDFLFSCLFGLTCLTK